MMRKICKILCVGLLLCAPVRGQVTFSETTHFYGQLSWYEKGLASFTLTNHGQKALTIKDVRTSCGCTTVSWDRSPIPSGASATLRVTMNAEMLGQFEKSVAVYTDYQEKPYFLKLKGTVVMEKDVYDGDYPYHVGDVHLSTDNIEFDDVNKGERPEQVISVYNAGKTTFQPELMHLPKYLSVRAVPEKLLPGRTGKMIVTLDSRQTTEVGLTQTQVYLSRYQGDRVGHDNELSVSAVVLPAFDTVSVVQTALAPMLELDTTELTLPPLNGKKKVKGYVILRNAGKSSLEVRSLQVFHPAVGVDLGRMKLAPGRSEKLYISLDARYLNESRSRYRVLMITNDPKRPKVIIDVKLG